MLRTIFVVVGVLLGTSVTFPGGAAGQVRIDTIGPAMSWQIQPQGEASQIAGVLFTSAGQPLRRARIRLSGLDGWVESDDSGFFAARSPQAGMVEVRIEALGYHTVSDSVYLPVGRSVFLAGVLREAVIRITPDSARLDSLSRRR